MELCNFELHPQTQNINGKINKVKLTNINILSKNNNDFRNLKKIVVAEHKVKEWLQCLLH
jgi:hypothetical protein